jgi:aspartyl-tRNA(Asn)/glutamyl-tRNA(Gln) amidotransferase subunit A
LEELTPSVRTAWQRTLAHLSSLGHTIHPVSLPMTLHALSAYYILAPAEASSNLAKYDGVRYGHRAPADRDDSGILFSPTRASFGNEVRRRILLGAYTLSSKAINNYFLKAQAVRRLVQQDFDSVFSMPNFLFRDEVKGGKEKIDVLLAPTALSTAPPLEEVLGEKSPLDSYVNDVLTVPASLAGIPAASVPVATGEEGLSVGMQIIAQYGDEERVWEVAKAIEGIESK